MGCSGSKNNVQTGRRNETKYSPLKRTMSMPVQAQQNKSDSNHVVALTSSTYGILKVDPPKQDGSRILESNSSSAKASFYEKLKSFDVPADMVAKPWLEVSLSLPKILPPTKIASPRPYRMPHKSEPENINMWELMDGLEEDSPSPAQAETKLKSSNRAMGSPIGKTFGRSITFATIHTVNELDSGNSNMAISPRVGGTYLKSSKVADANGKENAQPVWPPSISQAPSTRVGVQSRENQRAAPSQHYLSSKVPTNGVAATLKQVSDVLLLPPSSPRSPMAGPHKGKVAAQVTRSPMVTAQVTASPKADQSRAALIAASHPHSKSGTDVPRTDENSMNYPMSQISSGRVRSTAAALNQNQERSSVPPPSPQISSPLRVGAVPSALGHDGGSTHFYPSPRRAVSDAAALSQDIDNMCFPSPIHVLSMAASFDLESMKQSLSPLHPKAPPKSPLLATWKAGGGIQGGRQPLLPHLSLPAHKDMPSIGTSNGHDTIHLGVSSKDVIRTDTNLIEWDPQILKPSMQPYPKSSVLPPSPRLPKIGLNDSSNISMSSSNVQVSPSGLISERKGVGASPVGKIAPSPRKGASPTSHSVFPARKGVSPGNGVKGTGRQGSSSSSNSALWTDNIEDGLDPDLLASFEEALELFSADDWYNVRSSNGEASSISGSEEDEEVPMAQHSILEKGGAPSSGDGNARGNKILESNTDGQVSLPVVEVRKSKPDLWERFELKCPPGGEDRVVLYTTSLRGIRKTFEDCNNVRYLLQSQNVAIDERDVAIHAEFRQELKDLVEKPVPVPRVFISGRYIGGADEVVQFHEDGTLMQMVEGLPAQMSREDCDGCGGVRFVPCSDCSGSCKIISEANEVVRCPECNENGLMRCPICY